ncbi:MAG: ABC transporter permease [Trueperaceae bacterium]|nr:ABC transporter permease [Trueperaceae bacterium]
MVLFALAIVPFIIALRKQSEARGWLLVGLGNLLLILTLLLPAIAGQQLVNNPGDFFEESVRASDPRVLPSAALALGLLGSYFVLFAGLRDLEREGVSDFARSVATWGGGVIIVLLLLNGTFDVYSIMIEFYSTGELLGQKFTEHLAFVAISLVVGTVVGIGLGLWASRDDRIAPVILYTVGIIQTIPSLALFGVLLVPLAALGSQEFLPTLYFFLASLGVAAVVVVLYVLVADRLQSQLRTALLIVSAIATAVPLALLTGVLVSVLFRVSIIAFTSGDYGNLVSTLVTLFLVGVALWAVARWLLRDESRAEKYTTYASWLAYASAFVTLIVLFVQAGDSSSYLGRVDSISTMTMRDLGVRGIGVTPALVALTLYSLLPLVRNTYAGLNNVDNAIIDSGRGMGMTPSQRFFQIELPIALPVIMAGIRNAGVALVGIGTVATVIGAGGLGDFVIQGIVNTSVDQILLGALPAIALALVLDAGLRGIESLLTSPGIKQVQS